MGAVGFLLIADFLHAGAYAFTGRAYQPLMMRSIFEKVRW